jgi:hypothetical protein
MPSHTASHIKSVRLELGGVLLAADCSQFLALKYRPRQRVLAVTGYSGLSLLAGASFLPSKLLKGEGVEDLGCLVFRACWQPAPLGKPVGQMLDTIRQTPGCMLMDH